MKNRFAAALLALAAVGLPAGARANLTYFEVSRWESFTQTSDSAPAGSGNFFATARVFANVANEVMHGTVQLPSTSTRNLNPNGAFVTGFTSANFASEAALDAVWGTGSYTFTLTDGPHAGQSDSVSFNNPGWADVVPHLTGGTFSALQGMSASSAATFAWDDFSAGGDHTSLQTYFYVTDLTTSTQIYANQANPSSFTGVTLAANTLIAGHDYQFQLLFGSLNQATTTGLFAPAKATSSVYRSTVGRFHVVPEPVSIIGLAPALLVAMRRRRTR